MAEYCPLCSKKAEFLHTCSDQNSSELFGNGSDEKSTSVSLASIVILAPLMGVVLDLFLPLPSSLLTSALISIIGSAILSFLWVSLKFDRSRSFRFFFRNIKNFLYTPNILKIYGADTERKVTSRWFGIVALSTAMQIFLFTPGNATFIESTISYKIERESSVDLAVECPGTQIYFYQDPIKCRVKTGLLWISVPARVTLSPIVGTFSIKVSLL